ncbi:EVE domain-containing protein [Temperatibacter marinus]|uniref:EVE domain-containing protein n=1 Tax=Temperatibacter marinus TaxID=1456591 RepID=A0AA52EJN2_9PROT|nr:EVE domain-containing protein [Temperatibacter marinus]WND03747.1 EVE domain-containing protein [Temperatibacter marinus]
MRYWLVKSEPHDWSWSDQNSVESEPWTGVRNYQAQNHMRSMAKGDNVLFYHSGKTREIVGICTVSRAEYPDPSDETGRWCLVDLKAKQALREPVTLTAIKADSNFADLALVRQPRLSVMPITEKAYSKIIAMGGL